MLYQHLVYWVKKSEIFFFSFAKNLILLNITTPTFANSVDPDQPASVAQLDAPSFWFRYIINIQTPFSIPYSL